MKDFIQKNKPELLKLAIITVLYLAAIIVFAVVDAAWWVKLIVFLVIYFAVGYEIIIHAFIDFPKEPFNEKFLMVLASVGAFILMDCAEAVAVMYFFSIGELFEDYAEERSESAIEDLVAMMEKTATIEVDGVLKKVDVSAIKAGDIIFVKSGERVSADGVLLDEEGYFDTSMITGESKPKRIVKGELVRSGYLAKAPSRIEAERVAEESSAAKIIELIKEAQEKKASSEKFITKFARFYTPIVIGLAVIVAFLPPIFGAELTVWVRRALNLLVISCPCALVVSVPIAFFVGIGKAFERGIVVKGSAVLEKVSKAEIFAFDKTGTLTEGDFTIIDVQPREKAEEILILASSMERFSAHPIAKTIVESCEGAPVYYIENVQEIAGNGLIGAYMRKKLVVGSAKLAREHGYNVVESKSANTAVYVCYGDLVGTILIGDVVKENSARLIGKLNDASIKTVMLTGDNELCAKDCAKNIGIVEYEAGLLPEQKVEKVEGLKKKGLVAFVGDGINDAPVLSSADVSIAMGSGSDIAADCADVVIVGDDPYKINRLRRIAKKTMRVVYTNIIGSIAVKAFLFALSIVGVVPLWLAIFGDVGVMVLATINSFALSLDKSL